jgi:hypothetical protein
MAMKKTLFFPKIKKILQTHHVTLMSLPCNGVSLLPFCWVVVHSSIIALISLPAPSYPTETLIAYNNNSVVQFTSDRRPNQHCSKTQLTLLRVQIE